jgi:hypothetical protein
VIKSRRIALEDNVARMGQMRYVYKFLIGEPERKKAYVGPRCRWEDNIRIDLNEPSGFEKARGIS